MSSKKTKLLESAQKNALKGQIDRAIVEYKQLIELDPGDLRHRQRIAELLTKINRKDEAIKEYSFLAKHYIDSVHYLKAIAVYKQIQKLDPENPDISLTLASLNEKQGLTGNAIAEYASAVQIYEKTGENLKALKALECIMSLDSGNFAVKLRIAEKYFTTGAEDKSFEIFAALLSELSNRSDENGYSLIAERAFALFGERVKEIPSQITDESSCSDFQSARDTLPAATSAPLSESQPDLSDIASPSILPNSASMEFEETTLCNETDYIEDILPLEDDEQYDQSPFSENLTEWEEEVDLPCFDASFDSDGTLDSGQEVLEELDAVDELEEIELELEEDTDLSEEPGTQTFLTEDMFDLGKELSLFADDIDFGLFAGDEQGPIFDSTTYGFKKGELDNEDAESHYSLGLAYKEMGLLDEAIGEFIVASCSPLRKIDALTLQGVCLRELGNIDKAVEMLSDTLKDDNITEDECLGVQYELALCHESSGDYTRARTMLTDIIAARPTYSDVATRLKNLPG